MDFKNFFKKTIVGVATLGATAAVEGKNVAPTTGDSSVSSIKPMDINKIDATTASFSSGIEKKIGNEVAWGPLDIEKLRKEINDENIKIPESYRPSTVEQRNNWNSFLKFLYQNHIAGSKELDVKDRSLGLAWLEKYNIAHPEAQVPKEYIIIAQVENKMMRKKKIMPFLDRKSSDEIVKYMPNFLDHPASDEDYWMGSITTTESYPTLGKSGGSYKYKYDFGTDYNAFLKFQHESDGADLSAYNKYVIKQMPAQPIDATVKN